MRACATIDPTTVAENDATAATRMQDNERARGDALARALCSAVFTSSWSMCEACLARARVSLSLIHISEPTRR
eukprot:6973771-Lingulodinium_polyedra.AAC.1